MKPIIFSGESVRAILEGRKTMTRRVIKAPKIRALPLNPEKKHILFDMNDAYPNCDRLKVSFAHPNDGFRPDDKIYRNIECPYGQVGDRLWVKETWKPSVSTSIPVECRIYYKACGYKDVSGLNLHRTIPLKQDKWRSPIFLFRWASRITLEITGIKVERLQDISPADATHEGIGIYAGFEVQCAEGYEGGIGYRNYYIEDDYDLNSPIDSYKTYWDSLNAKRGYSWDTNPFVWVISFKEVKDE